MKSDKDEMPKNRSLSRGEFLKCTGRFTGLYLTSPWFKESNSNTLAQFIPQVVSLHYFTATNCDYVIGYYW